MFDKEKQNIFFKTNKISKKKNYRDNNKSSMSHACPWMQILIMNVIPMMNKV